jgi:hypothetical protein
MPRVVTCPEGIDIACIEQQSTFWRRSLWERSGARLDAQYNLVAHFELWARFCQHAELYGIAMKFWKAPEKFSDALKSLS